MNTRNFWNTMLVTGALALATTGANAQYMNYSAGRIVNLSGGSTVLGPNGGAQTYYSNPYASNGNMPYNNYNPYGYGAAYGNYNANSGAPYGYNGGNYYNPYLALDPYGYYGYYGAPTQVDNYVNGNPVNPVGNVPEPDGTVPADTTPANVVPANRLVTTTVASRRALPRTTDSIDAKRLRGDRFNIVWKGENSAVNKITFAMLDLNKRPIMTRTVTQPPGEYTFPITSRMVYYQVVVEYVNGTTNTVTSPL